MKRNLLMGHFLANDWLWMEVGYSGIGNRMKKYLPLHLHHLGI